MHKEPSNNENGWIQWVVFFTLVILSILVGMGVF